MSNMTPTNLDPISVAQVVAGLALNPTLAGIIGPYSVIFLASIGGAAASLADDKEVTTRLQAFVFFLRGMFVSLLFTVSASTLVAHYFDGWDAQWFFLPVAAVLSYASGKWKLIFGFFIDQGKSWVTNWVNSKAPPK